MATRSRYGGAGGGSDMLGLVSARPQGMVDPNYSAPQLDSRDFMSARGATLGAAPQGVGQVRQASAAAISPLAGAMGRGTQADLITRLQAIADGKAGPSAASLRFQQGADATLRAAQAMRAGGLPGQFGAHQATTQAASLGAQAAQDAAAQTAAEQQQARAELAGVAGQMRDQDINVANANAGFGQQANLANMDAYNRQLAADMALRGQYGLTQGGFNQQANMQNAAGRQGWAMGNAANNMWAQGANGAADEAWNHYLEQIQLQKMAGADALEKGAFKTVLGLGTGGLGFAAGGM